FMQPRRAVAARRPDAARLPAAIRIVDAAVHPLGVEAHRIGHAHHHPFAVDQRKQRVVLVAGRDRHVLAEAERVVLIDPGVVARLGAVLADAGKARTRILIETPAFGTGVTGRGGRAVERAFALAAIELAEMARAERHPDV